MHRDLATAIRNRRAILFAGAGLSMTVGLPSWRTLSEHIAGALKLPPEVLADPGLNHQILAEYYRLREGSIGPLRSWMDRSWSLDADTLRASRVHEIVCELDFPIIYTTNYDRNLETALEAYGKPYVKIVNAKDMARISDGVTQVVKFHGDFDDDSSIVIAETNYLDRLSFESPLDIKLRSDSLGRTILFIGYSMSDLNIRFLLHRLWKTWQASGFERDRPQSFVFMIRTNPVETAVLEQWGIRVIADESNDPEHALETFLSELLDAVRDASCAATGGAT